MSPPPGTAHTPRAVRPGGAHPSLGTTGARWRGPPRRTVRILLGLATAWQLVYAALFTGTLLRVLLSGFAPMPGGAGLPDSFGPLFLVHLATLVLMLGLAVYYVSEASRSPRVPPRRRALWVALNVVLGFFAQIVFWYLYVWREPEPLPTTLVRPGRPPPR